MVSAVSIQAKINKGERIASAKLGEPCDLRRPTDPLRGPAAETVITTLNVWFTSDFKFSSPTPNLYNKPIFGALCDRTVIQVGDYLFAASNTYFVAAMQPLLATAAVQCNVTLTILRDAAASASTSGFGATLRSGNAGSQRSNKATIASGWPASLLAGTKGESNPSHLPDDVRAPWCAILLPAIPGVVIETTDQLEDNLGRVWTVSSVELTDLGYRFTAAYAET